jgi:hypothetical protein
MNRNLLVPEITAELYRLAAKDLRIGQIFEIIRGDEDLFYLENDKILEKLKEVSK